MRWFVFLVGFLASAGAGAQSVTRPNGIVTTDCKPPTLPWTGIQPMLLGPNGEVCVGNGSSGGGAIVVTAPPTTPITETGATVGTGGLFQVALAANAARTGCNVQNTSTHTAYVYFLATGTATLSNAKQIGPGGGFDCANAAGGLVKTAIQWTTGTTGDTFVISENQ